MDAPCAVPNTSTINSREIIAMMIADAQKQECLVEVIAEMLADTVARNDKAALQCSLPSFSSPPPPLSPLPYVRRIAMYSGASPCCFAVGLIYLERMKRKDANVNLIPQNYQRLYLVAVMIAAKFLDDFYYSNKHWADVGGLTVKELNDLEVEFLFRMGFSLHMQREEYDWYADELHQHAQQDAEKAGKQFEEEDDLLSRCTTADNSAQNSPDNKNNNEVAERYFLSSPLQFDEEEEGHKDTHPSAEQAPVLVKAFSDRIFLSSPLHFDDDVDSHKPQAASEVSSTPPSQPPIDTSAHTLSCTSAPPTTPTDMFAPTDIFAPKPAAVRLRPFPAGSQHAPGWAKSWSSTGCMLDKRPPAEPSQLWGRRRMEGMMSVRTGEIMC